MSPSESIFHDNGKGKPEMKFVNDDGREVVYDDDTKKIVTDPRFSGSYQCSDKTSTYVSLSEGGGDLNDACNIGIGISNIGLTATAATKNPYVGGATMAAVSVTTLFCATAYGAGQRDSLWQTNLC